MRYVHIVHFPLFSLRSSFPPQIKYFLSPDILSFSLYVFFFSAHHIFALFFFLSVFSVLSIFSSPLFSIARIISRDHLGSKYQDIDESFALFTSPE